MREVKVRNIFCLTAIDLDGKLLWQFGTPCPKFKRFASHVADQMIYCGLIDDKIKPEIAVLRKNTLYILDGKTGAIKRSRDLGADNYVIVRCIHTLKGNRLLIQNTAGGYYPYGYGSPALIYAASNLSLIATISNATLPGHSPRALDINNDGDDELLIGFDVYDADGKHLWRLEGKHLQHVDSLQVGTFNDPPIDAVVYAASKEVEMGTLNGHRMWKDDFGHPQHVVIGNFRSGYKSACIAIYNCAGLLGNAQVNYLNQSRAYAPQDRKPNNIAFVDQDGRIIGLVFPTPKLQYHSGEGIQIYPQGSPDGSDAIILKDWGWPQAINMANETPFVIPKAKAISQSKNYHPVGPGADGYGVRIADFYNDGRAEILIIVIRTNFYNSYYLI